MIRDGGATVIFQWTYSQCKPHDVIWNQNYGHIGTGLPYATGAMLADQAATGKSRPGMLLTSTRSFLFHIGELEVGGAQEPAAGLRRRRRLPVGPRSGRLQAHLRPGHRRDRHALVQQGPLRQDRRGLRRHGEFVDEGRGHRPGDRARLCARRGDRDPRADRPEGQLGRNAEVRRSSAPGTPKARSKSIVRELLRARAVLDKAARASIGLAIVATGWSRETSHARISEVLHRRPVGRSRRAARPPKSSTRRPKRSPARSRWARRPMSTRPSPPRAAPSPAGRETTREERLDLL